MSPQESSQLARLKQDFPYFAFNCLKIRSKTGHLLPLKLNRAQLHAHRLIEEQRARIGMVRVLALKGRQQGFSTYTEARFYHKVWRAQGQSAYILTHEDKATANLYRMTRLFHDKMPDPLRPATGAANANELVFPSPVNGRYTLGTAGTKGTGRSSTAQLFHGSEVGFWEHASDHLAGVGQAVPLERGTEIILESTGNGVGNLWHSMWQEAVRGVGLYIPIFIPWFWQTEYRMPAPPGFVLDAEEAVYAQTYNLDSDQMAWRREKVSTEFRGDVSMFDQEYPATPALAFRRGTGKSLIKPSLVEIARARGRFSGEARIVPSEYAPKILGVDPAEYGDDDSGIIMRQGRVASNLDRLHGKGTMEVVGIVARLADRLKPDAINVDSTGIGSGVADRLLELNYPVNRVHFGERAIDVDQYNLRRDECWGEMKEWFEDSPNVIPDDDSLEADILAPNYHYDSSRRLVVESKESMKRRGLKSPDTADALALTFAVRIAPKSEDDRAIRTFNSKILC